MSELLENLEERRVAAKKESDELIGQAKTVREDADTYAASKRKEADDQAAQILEKAGEDAASQIEDRRKAAQVELEDLQGRIAELQSREAAITQRVSELRSMFTKAFSGFGFMNEQGVEQPGAASHQGAPDVPLYNAAAQDEPAPAYESHAVAEHADNQDAEAVAAEPVAEHVAERPAEHTEAGEAETAE